MVLDDSNKSVKVRESMSLGTPMSRICYLDKENDGKRLDDTKYRGVIGSLLYFTTSRLYSVYENVLGLILLLKNLI